MSETFQSQWCFFGLLKLFPEQKLQKLFFFSHIVHTFLVDWKFLVQARMEGEPASEMKNYSSRGWNENTIKSRAAYSNEQDIDDNMQYHEHENFIVMIIAIAHLFSYAPHTLHSLVFALRTKTIVVVFSLSISSSSKLSACWMDVTGCDGGNLDVEYDGVLLAEGGEVSGGLLSRQFVWDSAGSNFLYQSLAITIANSILQLSPSHLSCSAIFLLCQNHRFFSCSWGKRKTVIFHDRKARTTSST